MELLDEQEVRERLRHRKVELQLRKVCRQDEGLAGRLADFVAEAVDEVEADDVVEVRFYICVELTIRMWNSYACISYHYYHYICLY